MSGKIPTRKQALNAIDVLSKVAKKGMVGYTAAPLNGKTRRSSRKTKKASGTTTRRKTHKRK